MIEQDINYQRIERAIAYIHANVKSQPSLDDIAAAVGLSPFHLQRTFTDWAGVSPKKFLQYLNVSYAKGLLQQEQSSLLDTAYRTGLSGTGRLHDLFVRIEGMTPGEFKKGGETLMINYSFASSPFGKVLVASTSKGVCHVFFDEDEQHATEDLKQRFPNASYQNQSDDFQQAVLCFFQQDWQALDQVKLHLKGTEFQLKVWEALLTIPLGSLSTYGAIAQQIGSPKASRAVGSAIGRNPIAFLIPCHRVIQASGQRGGYMWGTHKKSAMIGWEASKLDALET